MVAYQQAEKTQINSGDIYLALLIGAGVIIGDFILRHLPFW